MDTADFSGRQASKQREDFPDHGGFSQTKLHADHNFSLEYNILGVSDQEIPTAEDPRDRTAHEGTCRKAGAVLTPGKTTGHAAKENPDAEQCCPPALHIPAKKGGRSKSAPSDVLQQHLSEEKRSKGQGSHCETPPEVSSADGPDEAVVKSIVLHYVKSFWPKEPTPEFTGQLTPPREEDTGSEASCCPATTAENASEIGEPVAAADGSLPQSSTFLTKLKSPSHKQKGGQEQALQTENTGAGPGFKYGQVRYWFSDRSGIAPPVKIPENNTIDKPLPTDKAASFSPELRAGLALGQGIPEGTARPDRAKKEEQERKTGDPSQQTEAVATTSLVLVRAADLMQPAAHSHLEHLTGRESETRLWKLSWTPQEDPSLTSSIFRKIAQGREMCQKLREQADQLKTKVQEFSRSLAQDSPGHGQDERLALETLKVHLELLRQEVVAEEQLTLEQRVRQPKRPAVSGYDPRRKAEGEVSRLEMLLEDVEGKADEGKHTSAGSLPESSPALPSASSPPSDEMFPKEVIQIRKKLSAQRCLCRHCLSWTPATPTPPEGSNVQRQPLGAVPSATGSANGSKTWRRKATEGPAVEGFPLPSRKGHHIQTHFSIFLYLPTFSCLSAKDSSSQCGGHPATGPDTGLSSSSASGAGLQSTRCETCSTRTPDWPRGGRKEPRTEFHYRYNTPGQNYLNHSEGRAFVQLRFLNGNENSPPSYSKPNWICSQRANSEPSQDEREPKPGKKNLKAPMTSSSDPATSSPHFHSGRVSGSKSLGDVSCDEEMKSEGLTASLDCALRTATVLKETTDRMIRTIAEDLAKLQRWRNRLKY